jgi:glycosyltransferase involved in cell wall biosynthesis
MLRPGVKTTGVRKVIESCAELRKRGLQILLVIVGDGINRTALEMEGAKKLAGNILFLGKIPRLELYRYYSAADVFAFPGIEESLGMVYLEAQSAGLPVVAYQDWGAKDAIVDTETGLLSSIREPDQFIKNIETLLVNRDQRIAMREAAKHHIRMHHDAASNYRVINDRLQEVVLRYRSEL